MFRPPIKNFQIIICKPKRLAFIAIMAIAILCSCKRVAPLSEREAATARCLQEISAIPQMGALLKSRNKGRGQEEERSLEGMEIALTINGMIRSQGDPDEGIDSWCSKENSPENFRKILDALKQNDMPPTVAFIVGRLFDPVQAQSWLESGNLLGNMTYKLTKAKKKDTQKFIDDVERNDQLLSPLWKKFSSEKKFFRYPGNRPGRDAEAQQQIQTYLKEKEYLEVPSTINSRDDHFTNIYCAAMSRNEEHCLNLIKTYFRTLLLEVTYKSRDAARNIAGREVKHILVMKANQFTCDNLADILAWYKSLGVKFITIDEALSDPFYTTVDEKGRPAYRTVLRKIKRGRFGDKQGERD
ncbi:MAG: polysaccharide deacetylase family protein [Blastocatellia bacterium]|nr:polysaccharide deacetylase family protein [Blastocatellia bacterium]